MSSSQDIRQYEHRRAIFQPAYIDDLRPGSEAWIGREETWEASWIIEDGEYAGEWAWTIRLPEDAPKPPFVWVPGRDLKIGDLVREGVTDA